jgi:phage tail-like protein
VADRRERKPTEPYGSFHFRLVFDGRDGEIPVLEVSGLKTAARVVEIEEGGVNGSVHKRPDRSRWDNLVVRYATQRDGPLQAWRDAFLRDPFDDDLRRSGTISLLDDDGPVVRSNQFTVGGPVSGVGPSLAAGSTAPAIETLEIAHDGLTVSTPGGGPS